MALTPQEQQELALLEREEAQLGGLSQQEEQELALLEQEEAQLNQQAPTGALSPEEEQELALLEQEELELGVEEAEDREKSLLEKGIALGVSLGEMYDKYLLPSTVRSTLGSIAKGKGLEEAQFMPETKEAPRGVEIARDLGISDKPMSMQQLEQEMPSEALLTGLFSEEVSKEQAKPAPELSDLEEKVLQDKGALLSPAQIAGTGIDVAADPTIFLGPLKTAGKLLKGGTKFALRSSAKAADVAALGGKAEKALDVAGTIAQSTKKRLADAFKPAVAIDAGTFFEIADKNNIPRDLLPEAIEFGKRSVVSKLGRKVTETGGELAQRADKYVVRLNQAMNEKLNKIVPVGIPNKDEAGNLIREAYDEGLEAFFRDLE